MGFRALLFSKSVETNAAMTAACAGIDIRLKSLPDIFNAIEQVKISKYSCIIVDWADQPEANFLLKRARESAPNRETISIVIVDHEPTPAEMHDNHLGFLISRPISQSEAGEVLAKAQEKMQSSDVEDDADDAPASLSNSTSESHSPSRAGEIAATLLDNSSAGNESSLVEGNTGFETSHAELQENKTPGAGRWPLYLAGFSALALTAAVLITGPQNAFGKFSEVTKRALTTIQNTAGAAFYKPKAASVTPSPAVIDYQPDSKLNDSAANAPVGRLGIVATESTLVETPAVLPKAFDLPLPEPTVERPAPQPVRVARAPIPESMRSSPPIALPVVVTVNPAQMMPVSHSLVPPAAQQTSEPVPVNEETARGLLVHSVNPVYPVEGTAQKLHGPVVLQTLIGRDGAVEDIKIIRGYFILGKAASTAVKQWRFQPYTINGRAVSVQTTITINFSYPPS